MSGLRKFECCLAALKDHLKFVMCFSPATLSCPRVNAKYVGKLILTRIEVLPSEWDYGKEGQES